MTVRFEQQESLGGMLMARHEHVFSEEVRRIMLMQSHEHATLRDDQGSTEKFRPYARPGDDWLSWVSQQLSSGDEAGSLEEPETLDALDDINDFTIN